MAIATDNDTLTSIVKAIDDRLATKERKRIEWETKLTNVRNALSVLNNSHKQQAEAEKKFLENIKNRIIRSTTTTGEDALVSPQTPRAANAHLLATVESDYENDDDLVGYECDLQMGILPRTPERSPGTVMPSDPIPSVETRDRVVFPNRRDSIGLTQEPERPRSMVPTASESNSGGKRKRQELENPRSGKLKQPRQSVSNTAIPGPSSMAPPPRPIRPLANTSATAESYTRRAAAAAGEKKTTNLLNAFQRGERYMSEVWKEESVPPGAFCTCGKTTCKICRAQKHGR